VRNYNISVCLSTKFHRSPLISPENGWKREKLAWAVAVASTFELPRSTMINYGEYSGWAG